MEIFFNIDETEKGFLYEESMRMLRTNLQFSGGNLRGCEKTLLSFFASPFLHLLCIVY